MLIKNARILLPDGEFSPGDLRFSDRIEEIGHFPAEEGLDAAGGYLLPGLIDLHTHGLMGGDFSEPATADMGAMARHYATQGVTSFLATAMTLPEDALCRAAAHIAAFRPEADMASCLGLHMEGPFLSWEKRGAQNGAYLCAPDEAFFARVKAAAEGCLRRVTLAPEMPGALPFIARAARETCVSLGHTTCDYDTAAAAFEAGATLLTHMYNGMNGLHHRAPGPIGAGMDAEAYAELIADGLHVHPAALRAAFMLFPGRIVLVSDSLACMGMPDGAYRLGGQSVTKRRGRCTLRGSETLAGSVITLYEGMKNALRFGIPLETAAAAATHNPARALGLEAERGFIRPGLWADLLLLDPSLRIRAVYTRGHAAFIDKAEPRMLR